MFTGSSPTEAVLILFSISSTPLNFAGVFRKRLYRSCDVQLSAMFKLTGQNYFRIFLLSLPNLFMHAFIQSFHISTCKNYAYTLLMPNCDF